MSTTRFEKALTLAFHAVAIGAVAIATAVGATLLQPESTPATSVVQAERAAPAVKPM